MNIEIWHRSQERPDKFTKGQTLEVFSVSDDNTCELAYLHTCENSLTQIQDPSNVAPTTGDIFVLIDEDKTIPPRAYEITVPDCSGGVPTFVLTEFVK